MRLLSSWFLSLHCWIPLQFCIDYRAIKNCRIYWQVLQGFPQFHPDYTSIIRRLRFWPLVYRSVVAKLNVALPNQPLFSKWPAITHHFNDQKFVHTISFLTFTCDLELGFDTSSRKENGCSTYPQFIFLTRTNVLALVRFHTFVDIWPTFYSEFLY